MSLQGTPQAGSFVNVQDKITGGTTTAGNVVETIQVGNQATGITYTVGTGSPQAANLVYSGTYTLTGGGGTTLDLTNLTGGTGTKTFAKVRMIRVQNQAAADSGFTVAIGPGASNGFSPFLTGTTPTLVLPANSSHMLECLNTAGWTVNGSNKTILLNPGANTQTVLVAILGE
jgi:hypothetical protein